MAASRWLLAPMNIKFTRATRTGRQHFNDLVGVQAFERGDAILHNRPIELCRAAAAVHGLLTRSKKGS